MAAEGRAEVACVVVADGFRDGSDADGLVSQQQPRSLHPLCPQEFGNRYSKNAFEVVPQPGAVDADTARELFDGRRRRQVLFENAAGELHPAERLNRW